MDNLNDTYGNSLANDDEIYDIVIDTPSTAASDLSDIYASWNADGMRSAIASLSETCRKVSESIRPAFASYLTASQAVSSAMRSMAESIKPLTSVCAMEGVKSAVEAMRDSIALSPAVSEAFQCTAASSVAAMTERLQDSIKIDPAISTALASSVQTSLAESVKPLVASCAMEGVFSVAQKAREMLAESSILAKSVSGMAQAAFEAVRPAAGILSSVQSAFGAISEKVKASFDFSKVTAAIRAFDCSDVLSHLRERLANAAFSISDIMRSIWDRAGRSPRGLMYLLFRMLRAAWRRRPRFLLPVHESVKEIAARVNIGLTPPKQVREFTVQIRQIYLLRRQDRGSSDEDGNVITIPVAC